jgi:hypothetical protein
MPNRVTLVVEDNTVIVDGFGLPIDLQELKPGGFLVVQWYADQGFGEIEFPSFFLQQENRWDRKPNQFFNNFTIFQKYVDAWIKKKEDYDRDVAELRKALEEAGLKLLEQKNVDTTRK